MGLEHGTRVFFAKNGLYLKTDHDGWVLKLKMNKCGMLRRARAPSDGPAAPRAVVQ